jgi:hypothetical protein
MEEVLRKQGFCFIRRLGDGTYVAQYRNITYYGLYVVDGVVKQR